MVRVIGFTGTRRGMTIRQKSKLTRILSDLRVKEAHHGDCIGGDEEFHDIVRLILPACRVIVHPGPKSRFSANCKGDVILPRKPFLVRNKDIVEACGLLIACPFEWSQQYKGGTWHTHNYAQSRGKPILLLRGSKG